MLEMSLLLFANLVVRAVDPFMMFIENNGIIGTREKHSR